MNSLRLVNRTMRAGLGPLFGVIAMLAGANVSAVTLSTQFSLSGYVNAPASFNLSDLQAYAAGHGGAVSVTVPKSGGGTDTYSGVSLYGFLSSYIKTDPTVPKNDILRDYVLATGTDGYRAAFSLGELDPNFGNKNDIIAYELNGKPLDTLGFARIVAPADVKAGRWVSKVASLTVGHVPCSRHRSVQ